MYYYGLQSVNHEHVRTDYLKKKTSHFHSHRKRINNTVWMTWVSVNSYFSRVFFFLLLLFKLKDTNTSRPSGVSRESSQSKDWIQQWSVWSLESAVQQFGLMDNSFTDKFCHGPFNCQIYLLTYSFLVERAVTKENIYFYIWT